MQEFTVLPKNIDEILRSLAHQNYHRHSSYSNSSTPDSATFNEDYAKRAKDLKHGILSSCEHGYQGNYWEAYGLAKEYDLKFIFCAEAYWVKDMHEKDRTNGHIILIAKNENGRRAINKALSKANRDGYFYKPRLDVETILSLPKDDVFITTACVAFWKYEDIDEIVLKLHKHFQSNFMLEVQYHNTELQKETNKHILRLHNKYGIKLIMGCDSHYIHEKQKKDRECILKFKGIHYDDEDGWFMDYPSSYVAYHRFKKQGILTDLETLNAINNTNLILEFDDIFLNDDIKLPTLYPDKTQKEKNEIYKKLIMKEWKIYKEENHITKDEEKVYMKGIREEVKIVMNTNMADYFILDYYLVKKGLEKGGVITKSGRGSAVSFFTNTLLGFSNVDRFIAPVHLFPERFMSESRILETKSLPDIDMNLGTVEPFAEAQEEILGEGHSYPMIAYGTLQVKAAWKMYAGANDIKPELSDIVSKQIEQYETDLKYADDDEKDTVDIKDYVSAEYTQLLEESKIYQGIIDNKKKHPCGYLIYSGDIESEIGLIKCKSETTKKEYMVALIDGKMADKYKYLKNDLLKVDVSLVNNLIAKRIGIKEPTIRQLSKIVETDTKVWDIYKNGFTIGINQCEKKSTTKKVQRYLPTNPAELSCFIAAIRPSFQSMYSIFENRQDFEYGIKSFDNVIQTEFIKDSFIFFQEQIMGALNFAGIPLDETMTIIKAISKKKKKLIMSYKERFVEGCSHKLMEEETSLIEVANELSSRVWQIIEDSASYGFNASHAYCMACDSMYGAYYKANYPYEFYEVMLNVFSKKGKKDKVSLFTQEMELAFGIQLGDFKFGLNNIQYTFDKENSCIHPALVGIKGIGIKDAEELYSLAKSHKYDSFLEIVKDIKAATSVNDGKLKTLIKLDYFSDYGKSQKLLDLLDIYNNLTDRKQISKDQLDKFGLNTELMNKYSNKKTEKLYKEINIEGIIKELTDKVEDKDVKLKEKLQTELELLGYLSTKMPSLTEKLGFVMKVDKYENKKSFTFYATVYDIKTGKDIRYRISDYLTYMDYPFAEDDVIKICETRKTKKRQRDGKIVENEFNNMLDWYEIY